MHFWVGSIVIFAIFPVSIFNLKLKNLAWVFEEVIKAERRALRDDVAQRTEERVRRYIYSRSTASAAAKSRDGDS